METNVQNKVITSQSMNLQNMPDEILIKVFSNLEMRELLVCGRLSKRISNLCHDKALWKNIKKSMEEKTNVWFPQNNTNQNNGELLKMVFWKK